MTKNIIFSLKQFGVFLSSMILAFSICCVTAYALTPSITTSTQERNYVANTWTYRSRGYQEQNCLAYALDDLPIWTWPWGASNPSKQQSQDYLKSRGCNTFTDGIPPLAGNLVYAYTLNDGITHFAKKPSGGKVTAKWGKCEIFDHGNADPYTNNMYGRASYTCKKGF